LQKVIADDLEALINVLPPHIQQALFNQEHNGELLEVVLDLGRFPEARYVQQELVCVKRK